MLLQILFGLFGLAVLGFAILTVTARSMFNAALALVGALFGVAAIFLLLEAEFLFVVQVMVYVGAIATLIVFAIMLSRNMMKKDIRSSNDQWIEGIVVAALLFIVLAAVLTRAAWPAAAPTVRGDAIVGIGTTLVDDFVVPFEVASVLLLVAMIGAIIIAREDVP